jgi:hypothetical protein
MRMNWRMAPAATLALLLASTAPSQQPGRLLVVDVYGKYGFVNPSDQSVIQPLFDFVWGFSEGLAAAWVSKEAGFIDANSGFVIPPQFSSARWFRDADCVIGSSK